MIRPPAETIIERALRLKCPRCGKGNMFLGYFRMHSNCPVCNFDYEREPGFYLGSIYVNYGMTAMFTTVCFLVLRFHRGYESREIVVPLAAFCIIFPLIFFRYARSVWLALDCIFDRSALAEEEDPPPPHEG